MVDWHERQTLGGLPERAARRWGPREALAFQGRRWTFAEVHARVDAVAKGLLELGIAPGDRVALRERAAGVDPEQSAFIFYTSGTTGFPKGAVHNHRMVRNTWDHGDRMGVSVNDVILMYLPLFHAFGFIEGPLMSMIRGARQVLTETFDPDECLDLLASERATIIHGFDTHYQELLEA